MKNNNLKTLSDLSTEEGPIYQRFQIVLKNWREKYIKRNNPGDINVIKFINHFGEFDKSSLELKDE